MRKAFLALLLILAFACGAHAQAITNNVGFWDTSSVIALPNNTTAGDRLVLMCVVDYYNGGRWGSVPSDTQGNTWTVVLDTLSTHTVLEQTTWTTIAGSSAADTITIHNTGGTSTNCIYAGASSAGYLDQKATQAMSVSAPSTTVTSPTVTTTVANEISFVFGGSHPGFGNGFSNFYQTGYTGIVLGSQYGAYQVFSSIQTGIDGQAVTGPGTCSGGPGPPSCYDAVMQIVTFAASGTSSTVNPPLWMIE